MTFAALSASVRADLKDVLEYRELYSDQAALRLADGFDQAIERLIQFPQSGSPREELGPEIRALVLNEFRLTLYDHVHVGEAATQVLVLRLLRQERDVGAEDLEAG